MKSLLRLFSNERIVKFLISLYIQHRVTPTVLLQAIESNQVSPFFIADLTRRFGVDLPTLTRHLKQSTARVVALLKENAISTLQKDGYIYTRLPLAKKHKKQFKALAKQPNDVLTLHSI